MGKIFGILVVVVGLWVSVEVFNEGTANAFGGLFVSAGIVDAESVESQPLAERRGAKVEDAHAQADARRNRLLAE